MIIGIHGLGYVGLVGAVHFAQMGVHVIGYDPDVDVVRGINVGFPKAREFLGYLGGVGGMSKLVGWPATGDAKANPTEPRLLSATIDVEDVIDKAKCHILAVPSERAGKPDMSIVEGCFAMLCRRAPSNVPIIVESTLQPGMAAKLRIFAGPRPWAIAPRRDWFASPSHNLESLIRVVGVDDQYKPVIAAILETVSPNIKYCTPETAEITKALENALFHGSVMLVHQLSRAYPNHDVVEAAALAITHWRFESYGSLYPSIGSGGRCVPVGSQYLLNPDTTMLQRALVEDFQTFPSAVAQLINSVKPRHVLVLGAAYRPGFADAGNSPGIRLLKFLDDIEGGALFVHDPYLTGAELKVALAIEDVDEPLVNIVTKLGDALVDKDVVVLATGHPEYSELWKVIPATTRVVDATGLWEGKFPADRYRRPGRPGWLQPWS